MPLSNPGRPISYLVEPLGPDRVVVRERGGSWRVELEAEQVVDAVTDAGAWRGWWKSCEAAVRERWPFYGDAVANMPQVVLEGFRADAAAERVRLRQRRNVRAVLVGVAVVALAVGCGAGLLLARLFGGAS